jgi:hypothetical protein
MRQQAARGIIWMMWLIAILRLIGEQAAEAVANHGYIPPTLVEFRELAQVQNLWTRMGRVEAAALQFTMTTGLHFLHVLTEALRVLRTREPPGQGAHPPDQGTLGGLVASILEAKTAGVAVALREMEALGQVARARNAAGTLADLSMLRRILSRYMDLLRPGSDQRQYDQLIQLNLGLGNLREHGVLPSTERWAQREIARWAMYWARLQRALAGLSAQRAAQNQSSDRIRAPEEERELDERILQLEEQERGVRERLRRLEAVRRDAARRDAARLEAVRLEEQER